jgi:hypothetical protein
MDRSQFRCLFPAIKEQGSQTVQMVDRLAISPILRCGSWRPWAIVINAACKRTD